MGIGQFEKRVAKGLPEHLFVSSDGNLFDTRLPNWSTARPLRTAYAGHGFDCATVAGIKAALRAGQYAWPGGYQLAFVACDGGAICFDCARAEFRNIAHSVRHNIRDGWKIEAVEMFDHCEETECCDHCSAVLCEPMQESE